jgi:hypothetical protein
MARYSPNDPSHWHEDPNQITEKGLGEAAGNMKDLVVDGVRIMASSIVHCFGDQQRSENYNPSCFCCQRGHNGDHFHDFHRPYPQGRCVCCDLHHRPHDPSIHHTPNPIQLPQQHVQQPAINPNVVSPFFAVEGLRYLHGIV